MKATEERLTQDELLDLMDEAADGAEAGHLRYRLRTVCSNCRREGAEEHYDREGIYAGRWHPECATDADRHRENYRWQPGDEPLDEE